MQLCDETKVIFLGAWDKKLIPRKLLRAELRSAPEKVLYLFGLFERDASIRSFVTNVARTGCAAFALSVKTKVKRRPLQEITMSCMFLLIEVSD